MKYSKENWIAAYKQAVKDTKTTKPTSGLPCAIASLRTIRDGLLADGKGKAMDADAIRKSFSEMIQEISTAGGVDDGFLSNASAAAKAAGFKPESEALSKLME